MSTHSHALDHVRAYRWRQGEPDLACAEARLHDLGTLRGAIDEAVELAVADARDAGLTWDVLGAALGVTRHAVVKRYGGDGRRNGHPGRRGGGAR